MNGFYKEIYGSGPPVIMLHGWAMHSGVWRLFVKQLAVEHQVICLDLPGHGLSETIEPYTLESVVDAIHAQLPDQACHLVGWSLGGNIAMRLAEKYPLRVSSLQLIACNPHFISGHLWQGVQVQVLDQFAGYLQSKPEQTLLRFIALQMQGLVDIKFLLKQINQTVHERQMPTQQVLMQALDILKTVDQRKTLSKLKMPVQMILGEHDTLVPVQIGEPCRLLLPSLELHIIADAGHIPFITSQSEMLHIISDFMARNQR